MLLAQERDGAEAFVDVLQEHLIRWQKHCGVGFPVHGPPPAVTGDAQPGAIAAAHGASMPARPSDSSSSLAAPDAVAAAYDMQLKALTVRLCRARSCHSSLQ